MLYLFLTESLPVLRVSFFWNYKKSAVLGQGFVKLWSQLYKLYQNKLGWVDEGVGVLNMSKSFSLETQPEKKNHQGEFSIRDSILLEIFEIILSQSNWNI